MVDGLDRLNKRWSAIPKRMKDEVRIAMEKAADEVIADMYHLAPHLTGDLAGSINWTWGDAPAGTMTIASVGGNEYGTMALTIYAGGGNEFYARYQEFGTTKMAANPFFFPAWRIWKRRIVSRISAAMRRAIKSA